MINHFYRYLRSELNIMDYRLEKILRESPAEKICNHNVARGLDLYLVFVNGYGLVFMKSHKPYGARCYRLDDNLAKVLGFGNIQRLKAVLPIRKSRKYLSIDNLRRAINRFGERSMGLEPMPRKRQQAEKSEKIKKI